MTNEQRKQLIDNAPKGATHCDQGDYMRCVGVCKWEYYSNYDDSWGDTEPESDTRNLDDLRAIVERDERIAELELILVAITHADETGYVDGEGWVEGWNEVQDEVKQLLGKFKIEQQIKALTWLLMDNMHCEQLKKGAIRDRIEQLHKQAGEL